MGPLPQTAAHRTHPVNVISTYKRYGALGLFEVDGDRDLAASLDFWTNLAWRATQEQLAGVLIRDQARDCLQAHEIMLIEQTLRDAGLPYTLPVAIVDRDATEQGNNRFGELVVGNRGWSLIRVFRKEADAWAWLDSQVAQTPPRGDHPRPA